MLILWGIWRYALYITILGFRSKRGIIMTNGNTNTQDSMLKAIMTNGANKVLPEPSTDTDNIVSYGIYDIYGKCIMSGQASSYTKALKSIEEFINDIDITEIDHISIKSLSI